MSKPQLATNPFYALLVVVGLAFALTACSYGVLMVKMLQPEIAATLPDESTGLLGWLNRHGTTLLMVELILLAICTFAAIGTDSYWTNEQMANPK